MGEVPYVGSRIRLINKSEIRYEGTLVAIDTKAQTLKLCNVRSFGTEDRRPLTQPKISASTEVYEYGVFHHSDIKDLQVFENRYAGGQQQQQQQQQQQHHKQQHKQQQHHHHHQQGRRPREDRQSSSAPDELSRQGSRLAKMSSAREKERKEAALAEQAAHEEQDSELSAELADVHQQIASVHGQQKAGSVQFYRNQRVQVIGLPELRDQHGKVINEKTSHGTYSVAIEGMGIHQLKPENLEPSPYHERYWSGRKLGKLAAAAGKQGGYIRRGIGA